jgi:hypothetical protein
MLDPVIKTTSERLGLNLTDTILTRANNFYQRTKSSSVCQPQCLPFICIELSSLKSRGPFNIKDAVDCLGISHCDYLKDKGQVAQSLRIDLPNHTLEDLSVMFGCTNIVSSANKLIEVYKSYYKTEKSAFAYSAMCWDSKNFIIAVFHATAKHSGVNTINIDEYISKKLGTLWRKFKDC